MENIEVFKLYHPVHGECLGDYRCLDEFTAHGWSKEKPAPVIELGPIGDPADAETEAASFTEALDDAPEPVQVIATGKRPYKRKG